MYKSFKISNVFFPGIIILIFFISCSKENEEDDDGWNSCYSCTVDSWTGEFSGTCSYSDLNNNTNAQNLPVTITIEETAQDYLFVSINVVNYYSTSVSGELVVSDIVSFAGSGSSFTSSMYIKENELKLSGNSKKFHYKNDTILVIDEVINFEILKIQ